MSRRCAPGSFRFRPPAIAPPAELGALLVRAFAPPGRAAASADPEALLALAERLALLPRLAARLDPGRAEAELGAGAAGRLAAARRTAAVRELRFESTEAALAAAARRLAIEPALLKGRALAAVGAVAPGARPASDVDLLVPRAAIDAFRAELLHGGFEEVVDARYAHHDRPLRLPGGAPVELHRHLPGVRLSGRRFADWGALDAAGLLDRRPIAAELAPLRVPSRELAAAHALVHAFAQHGLQRSYPHLLALGDLLDLGVASGDAATTMRASAAFRAIESDLSPAEIDAVLELARALDRGEDPFARAQDDRAHLVVRHIVAAAIDDEYGRVLALRSFEQPLVEGSAATARLGAFARAFVPPARTATESRASYLGRVLARPFVLAARAARALRPARTETAPPVPTNRAVAALRALAADEPLRVRLVGDCMAPLLPHGATVEVAPLARAWPGDVVVVGTAPERLTAHRVIGWRRSAGRLALLTQADSEAEADAPVPPEAVVGRVSALREPGGRRRPIGARRLFALRRYALYLAAGAARRLRRPARA